MKFLIGIILIGLLSACTKTEEGLIGEWEGKTKRIDSNGELIESNISCIIKSISGTKRSVLLSVAGTSYDFEAVEDMSMLFYKDQALGEDSIVMLYISGSAELLNDTLLHFDHEVYAKKGIALLYSDRIMLDMVRK